MRAMVLENIGVSLKLVDRPDPMAGPGETLAFSTVRAFPKMLAGRLKNSHHGRQAGLARGSHPKACCLVFRNCGLDL